MPAFAPTSDSLPHSPALTHNHTPDQDKNVYLYELRFNSFGSAGALAVDWQHQVCCLQADPSLHPSCPSVPGQAPLQLVGLPTVEAAVRPAQDVEAATTYRRRRWHLPASHNLQAGCHCQACILATIAFSWSLMHVVCHQYMYTKACDLPLVDVVVRLRPFQKECL